MTHLEKHIQRVEAWAEARGLYETDSPLVQFGKMVEKVGELIMGIGKNDHDEIKDAIGDIRVCLISVCRIAGAEFRCDPESARGGFGDIRGDIGALVRNVGEIPSFQVKHGDNATPANVLIVNRWLQVIAAKYNLTLEECDNHAWEQIKDRTGNTVAGEFVKDKEPTNEY